MANSSPAILPITNPQQPTAPETTTAPPPVPSTGSDSAQSTSAGRSFFAGISETIRTGFSNRRPWSELVDRSAFSKPASVSDATVRIGKNYDYFRINYFAVVAVVLVVSLLTNPFSLILLAGLLAAWAFLYLFREPSDPPLMLCGRQISDREILTFLIISSAIVIFLTSVGTVLLSALMAGVAIVCVHGAFRIPEEVFLDEKAQPNAENTAVAQPNDSNPIAAQPVVATTA